MLLQSRAINKNVLRLGEVKQLFGQARDLQDVKAACKSSGFCSEVWTLLDCEKMTSPIDQRPGHPHSKWGYNGSTPFRSKHVIDKTRTREIRQILILNNMKEENRASA